MPAGTGKSTSDMKVAPGKGKIPPASLAISANSRTVMGASLRKALGVNEHDRSRNKRPQTV
jgi:hypothetical protein